MAQKKNELSKKNPKINLQKCKSHFSRQKFLYLYFLLGLLGLVSLILGIDIFVEKFFMKTSTSNDSNFGQYLSGTAGTLITLSSALFFLLTFIFAIQQFFENQKQSNYNSFDNNLFSQLDFLDTLTNYMDLTHYFQNQPNFENFYKGKASFQGLLKIYIDDYIRLHFQKDENVDLKKFDKVLNEVTESFETKYKPCYNYFFKNLKSISIYINNFEDQRKKEIAFEILFNRLSDYQIGLLLFLFTADRFDKEFTNILKNNSNIKKDELAYYIKLPF